jgi:hypothetical protein
VPLQWVPSQWMMLQWVMLQFAQRVCRVPVLRAQ